jgi:integrase
MALTNITCNTAKPKEKPYKLADGGGLYLLINPTGSKLWRMKYRFLNKEKLLSIGSYPLVTLAEAREERDKAKKLLINETDPMTAKKDRKRQAIHNSENTFAAVALEWHKKQKPNWSEKHATKLLRRFELDIFPAIGKRPIKDITAPELLEVLREIEKRGAYDTVTRVRQICGQIFRYGIATGKCERDIAIDLKGATTVARTGHYASLDIKELPEFLETLDRNEARLFNAPRRAIKLLMLTLVRTSELIQATWDEIDFENAVWEIPAERMKMRKAHIVPLSKQVIELLEDQKAETANLNTDWIFPGQQSFRKHMSNNTVLKALERMGYKGRMTGHGFRALGMSAIKEKLGYRHEVVDRQLAHVHQSKIDRAYDRAQFLDDRTKMLQEWANYIDRVRKA